VSPVKLLLNLTASNHFLNPSLFYCWANHLWRSTR